MPSPFKSAISGVCKRRADLPTANAVLQGHTVCHTSRLPLGMPSCQVAPISPSQAHRPDGSGKGSAQRSSAGTSHTALKVKESFSRRTIDNIRRGSLPPSAPLAGPERTTIAGRPCHCATETRSGAMSNTRDSATNTGLPHAHGVSRETSNAAIRADLESAWARMASSKIGLQGQRDPVAVRHVEAIQGAIEFYYQLIGKVYCPLLQSHKVAIAGP